MLSETFSELEGLIKTYPTHELEIELKLGKWTSKGHFQSTVNKDIYDRLLKTYQEEHNPIITKSVVEIQKVGHVNRRKIVYDDGTIIYQTKERIKDFNLRAYSSRLTVSRERVVDEFDITNPDEVRDRNRTTFEIDNGVILEFSEVKSRGTTTYEVELEFNPSGKFETLGAHYQILYIRFEDISKGFIYTTNEFDDLETLLVDTMGFNKIGNSKVPDVQGLLQARNLRVNDMVYGGLIPKDGSDQKSFVITFKADGLRKLLVINKTGIWIAYPPKYHLVFRFTPEFLSSISEKSKDAFANMTSKGVVVDGELMSDGVYHPFDLIYGTLNNKNVRELSYFNRLTIAKQICGLVAPLVKTGGYEIKFKEAHVFNNEKDFYTLTNQFLDAYEGKPTNIDVAKIPKKLDGLMFIPNDKYPVLDPFEGPVKPPPLRSRDLSTYREICKFKPITELTIDLRYSNGKVYAGAGARPRGAKIAGNAEATEKEFTGGNIPLDEVIVTTATDGDIVEFRIENYKLIQKGLRRDKQFPNSSDIAEDNWNLYHRPLTFMDLRGRGLNLIRSYHNSIKSRIYKMMNDQQKGKVLLDLGSGRGGDLIKWSGYSQVIAVEPNESNIAELLNRFSKRDWPFKLEVIKARAEDTELIVDEVMRLTNGVGVDHITLMLSMSFMWKTKQHTLKVVQTINSTLKPGGVLGFFTIDGRSVSEFMGNKSVREVCQVKFELFDKYSNPDYGRPLLVSFPEDTIVGSEQYEYLVMLDDFYNELRYKLLKTEKAIPVQKTQILGEEQRIYTSLYTFSVLISTLTEKPNQLIEYELIENLPPPIKLVDASTPSVPKPTLSGTPVRVMSPTKSSPIEKIELNPTQGDDDEYEPLMGYKDLVRLATIGDGSCFIHSFLKCCDQNYRNADREGRVKLARDLRIEIADLLDHENPKNPSWTYWESISDGVYPIMYANQIAGVKQKIDYSIKGLKGLFADPTAFIGDELYGLLAELSDIDIYIIRNLNDKIYVHSTTYRKGSTRDACVILGLAKSFHYETIMLDTGNGYQGLFEPTHPLREFLDGLTSEHQLTSNLSETLARAFRDLYRNDKTGVIEIPDLSKYPELYHVVDTVRSLIFKDDGTDSTDVVEQLRKKLLASGENPDVAKMYVNSIRGKMKSEGLSPLKAIYSLKSIYTQDEVNKLAKLV